MQSSMQARRVSWRLPRRPLARTQAVTSYLECTSIPRPPHSSSPPEPHVPLASAIRAVSRLVVMRITPTGTLLYRRGEKESGRRLRTTITTAEKWRNHRPRGGGMGVVPAIEFLELSLPNLGRRSWSLDWYNSHP